jgi:hypothetical protein
LKTHFDRYSGGSQSERDDDLVVRRSIVKCLNGDLLYGQDLWVTQTSPEGSQ